jgi:hypothetical protein
MASFYRYGQPRSLDRYTKRMEDKQLINDAKDNRDEAVHSSSKSMISAQDVALAGYQWGLASGNEFRKAALYLKYPEWREIFVGLPDDKSFLISKLKHPEKLELFAFGTGVRNVDDILLALRTFSTSEVVNVISQMKSMYTRQEIMARLTRDGRAYVEAELSRRSRKRMRSTDRIHFAKDLRPRKRMKLADRIQLKKDLRLKERLPDEMWEKVLWFTSPFCIGLLSQTFDIHPFEEQCYNSIWYEIFKDERWLDYVTMRKAQPGLLGRHLDEGSDKPRRNITLLLYNRVGLNSRSLFFESLRSYTELENGYEVDIGRIRLNIGVIKDRPYIKPFFPEGNNTTKYCFWTDIKREVRTIKASHITSGFIPDVHLARMYYETPDNEEEIQYMFSQEKLF